MFPTTVDFRGKMVPGLRVRIPPPKQATAGNGQATAPSAKPKPAPAPVETASTTPSLKRTQAETRYELDELPVSASDLDDEIPF